MACTAGKGVRGIHPTPHDIRAAKTQFRVGLIFESREGIFRSSASMVCCTPDQPLRKIHMDIRTSFGYSQPAEAIKMRDASLMAMTNGRCNKAAAHFSGLPLLDVNRVRFTKAVDRMIPEILDYNSQHHVLGVMLKPKKIAKFTQRLRFGYIDESLAGGTVPSSATAGSVTASLKEFGNVISKSDHNIMLNAPAGYGKSHMIKTVMRPLLVRRYLKQGVWFTALTGIAALGLGDGAGTLHSMAGIGQATGTAKDIFANMPERAKKRWRKLQVSTLVLCPCCLALCHGC